MPHAENAPHTENAPRAESAPLFELDKVGFSISGRALLEPLSLTLASRRMVGLVGHNGSGKSTLLKILARQQPATTGAVRFEGKALPQWASRPLARKLAYLPQQTPPAAGMLARELIALGRYPWHGALGRFGETDRAKVEEAIALTATGPLADRLVDTLSGGERQRVWLAMLVAQDTQCLLLDEPTSALDIGYQIEVLALIRRLSHSKGLGVVIVLHDINMAARFCDEILALRAGRLIAEGSPAEIMQPHHLRTIYGLEMDVLRHPATCAPVAVAR